MDMTTTNNTPRPSTKQLGLLAKLAVERGTTVQELANRKFDTEFDLNTLTGGRDGTASALITFTFGMPRVDGQGTTPSRMTPDEGLYRVGDDVVQIKVSKAGNWYARQAVKPVEGSGRVNLDWKYLGKRIDMRNAVPMTDEEAGRYLVFCMRCGAPLTNEDSIAAGIGPVCRNK